MQIAVAGKGGTGKTTFSALMIRQLVSAGHKPILAVDADANANLAEALGVPAPETVGDIVAEMTSDRRSQPGGMSKDRYLSYRMCQAMAEGDDFDLLVMGRPEGAGCYCYANNLLRGFVGELAQNYRDVIMDNEAGLEHLSRRTLGRADVLFIVSDATARGVQTAARVAELVRKVGLEVGRMGLVVNRAREDTVPVLEGLITELGLELWGTIPFDPDVEAYDLKAQPLYDLPEDGAASQAVRRILERIEILLKG
ncbi:MAG: carbon monoxide dehydrogenase [Desulforudis sp.]|nr:AAA family ATPase [Clostridia bacterium]MDQ7790906.1 AAA family ATPase [Clostridia bacterium]RJX17340.1 MAG: carbon monoxide dehydrogenase [Desulforudis sp.]